MPENIDAGLELVHRLVGYPLAFVSAPRAVATFAGKPTHNWSGKAYASVIPSRISASSPSRSGNRSRAS